jgi:hypothetical protein
MTNLIAAYQKNDISEFEKILKVRILCMVFFFDKMPALIFCYLFIFTCSHIVVNELCARAIEEQLWMIILSVIILKTY